MTAVFIFGAFFCFFKPSKIKSNLFLIFSAALLIIVSSLRLNVGFDYGTYSDFYTKICSQSFSQFLGETRLEIGFCALMQLCSFISHSPVFFFAVVSLIIISLTAVAIKISVPSRMVGFSVYFFMTLGFFYGSMNFLRQYLAAAISLFALKFIASRKFLPFLGIVLLASTMHISALILIPVYFIANIPLNKKSLITFSVLTVLLYLFSDIILNFVTKYIYQYYNPDTSLFMQGSGNIYVVVPVLLFLASLVMKNHLNTIYVNYSLYSLIIYVMMTRHFILERFAVYFSFVYIFIIPEIILSLYNSFEQSKLDAAIAKKTAKLQKGGRQKQLKASFKANENSKDSKNIFIAATVFFMCLAFMYQLLGHRLNFHGVFPYIILF